jgi:hypothetical protein
MFGSPKCLHFQWSDNPVIIIPNMTERPSWIAGDIVRKLCEKITLYNNISHCYNRNTGKQTLLDQTIRQMQTSTSLPYTVFWFSSIILCAVSFIYARFLAYRNSDKGTNICPFHVVCCQHFTLPNNLPHL